ncbi:hypothetical protein ACYULU_08910 [Breznakiellaceae bacterium SP9]
MAFRNTAIIALVLASYLFWNCATDTDTQESSEGSVYTPPQKRAIDLYTVIDSKNAFDDNYIPDWVNYYLNENTRGIEAFTEYQGEYIFVAAISGKTRHTLEQWRAAFSVPRDFPALVAARIEAQLLRRTAGNYPDDAYGSFYEKAIEYAADSDYYGAQTIDDFWLRRQFYSNDGRTVVADRYTFMVLLSIDKQALENQLRTLFETIPLTGLSSEQAERVAALKADFFSSF